MMHFRSLVVGSSLTALGLGFTMSALAQGIEEVIVTAQKREESAQDIPIAIDVITGDTFIREGVRDIKDMNKLSTELEINNFAGQASVIGIRGMQQAGFSPNADTLAAVHVDGAFISSFWSLNGLIFDLERSEVLAGPQGTLYGRNSAAGAVNLITRRPGDTLEANATVDVGNYNSNRVEAGISVPVGDTLAFRVAGNKWKRDSFFGDNSGVVDQKAGRLSMAWDVTDNDTIFSTVDYSDFAGTTESNQNLLGFNAGVQSFSTAGGVTTPVAGQPQSIAGNGTTIGPLAISSDPYENAYLQVRRNQAFKGDQWNRTFGAMAQWDHDFGSFGSTLQAAYRRNKDISYSNPLYTAPTAATRALPNTFTNDIDSTTVEFRLTSSGETSLKWVAGLFYFDGAAVGDNATPTNANFVIPTLANGRVVPSARQLNPETNLGTIGYPFQNGFGPNSGTTESWAIFGQTEWTPESMDRLHLITGLRYSADKKTALLGTWVNGTLASLVYDPEKYSSVSQLPGYVQPYIVSASEAIISNPETQVFPIGNDDWGSVQWRVGVNYDLTDSTLVYGSVATGYKSGGFAYGSTPRLEPEEILAFEIGAKTLLLDNTLQFNTSAWFYDYTNIEIGLPRPFPGNAIVCVGGSFNAQGQCSGNATIGTNSVANVEKAELGGVSFDLDWAATEADRFGLSGTYAYSKVIDGHETYNGVKRLVANEGERLGDAPEFNFLARYSHTFELSNGASVVPAVKYQWQSKKYDASGIPAGSYYLPTDANGNDVRLTTVNLIPTSTNPLVYNAEGRFDPAWTTIPSRGILDVNLTFNAPGGSWDVTAYLNNATDELNIRTLAYANNPQAAAATGNYGWQTATLGEPRTYGVVLNARF